MRANVKSLIITHRRGVKNFDWRGKSIEKSQREVKRIEKFKKSNKMYGQN